MSFGVECIAASMLRLVRDEVQAPVPDGLVERLWARRASLKALELAIRRTPPYRRGKLRRLALRAIELARTTPGETGLAAAVAVVAHREPRAHLLQALGECVGFAKPNLDRIWREQAERAMRLTGLSFARGFSFPEEEGRWTDGEIAVLELPVDTPLDATVLVLMVVRAFFPPGATEFAFKTATGIGKVRRHVLRPEQGPRVELTVEARAVGTPARKAVIVLQLLDAGRPIALGLSDDPRLLGLYVERIEALADNGAPQAAPAGRGVPPPPA